MILPDIFQEHGPGDDLVGMLHQILKKAKLARLQLNFKTAPRDFTGQEVKLKVANLKVGQNLARVTTTNKRLNAGEQFGKGVGLGQIIIAASLETLLQFVGAGFGSGVSSSWRTSPGMNKS